MNRKLLAPILITTLLGAPGVALLVFGAVQLVDLQRFHAHATVVEGRVASFTPIRATVDGTLYNLIVDYRAASGRTRQVVRQLENATFTTGQTVDVLIANGDVRIRGFGTTWTNPMIATVVGFLWSGFAGLILYASVRS